MCFVWYEGQTTDKCIANLSVLACNLILLRLTPSVTVFVAIPLQTTGFLRLFWSLSERSEQEERILCNPHCILMNVCGDELRAVSNSPASKRKSSALHVQIRLLIKPLQQNKKTHPGTAAPISSHTGPPASLPLSTPTPVSFLPYFILNLLHFSNLPSPSLFLTLHCLFCDSKTCLSLYLDALHSPSLLSLYHLSFFPHF